MEEPEAEASVYRRVGECIDMTNPVAIVVILVMIIAQVIHDYWRQHE